MVRCCGEEFGIIEPRGWADADAKSRFTEEQIAFALKQAETGTPVLEVCRKMGVSEQTYYRWKKQYGGLGVLEIKRLKLLEEKNRRLKQLLADSSLDKVMCRMCWQKSYKAVATPAARGISLRSVPSQRTACLFSVACSASHVPLPEL